MKLSGESALWIIVLYSLLQATLSAKLRCYKSSFEDFEEVQVETPDTLINSSEPCINVSKCTVFYVFGLGGEPSGYAVKTLMPTLISRNDSNVLLMNWEKEANGDPFGLLGYPLKVVPAIPEVGKKFGQALLRLKALGLRSDCIHIIAHSLGAHLACYAGRETKASGYTIPWITGLDPARPEFEPALFVKPIDKCCAEFVDAVHCDPGGYGMNRSVGHVDFWPNFGQFTGGNRLQPGCKKSKDLMDLAVNGNFCNHNRCVELYNASLVDTMALEGEGAECYNEWLRGDDDDDTDTNFIGPLADMSKTGNFYLSTAGVYPFGEGPAGLHP